MNKRDKLDTRKIMCNYQFCNLQIQDGKGRQLKYEYAYNYTNISKTRQL